MLHDCVNSFGDSGSPLLLIVDDQIYVAGFHVANGRAASNLLSVSLPVAVFDTASSELQTAEAPTGAGVVLLLMLLGLRVKEREGAATTAPPKTSSAARFGPAGGFRSSATTRSCCHYCDRHSLSYNDRRPGADGETPVRPPTTEV